MTKLVSAAVLLAAAVAVSNCAPRPRYYDHGSYERGYYHEDGRATRELDDEQAWDIVRRDPCRYDEYRRYAENHKNPERRREVVWRLAREGCSRDHEYDRRGYPVPY